MPIVLLAVLALSACEQASPPQAKPRKLSPEEFLRKAVVEGLKEDGADPAWVKENLTDQKLFVLKCPICEPVRRGFIEYGNSRPGEKPAGKGLAKDIVDDLKNPTRQTQLKALERLVDQYVSRHYERLKVTAEERQALHWSMEEGKKAGMMMKDLGPQKDFGDFCPSCNGAVKAK